MRKNSEERRKESNAKIKELGIDCLEDLPLVEDSMQVKLKSLDEICQRALACLIIIQLACDIDIDPNLYEEAKECIEPILKQYKVDKKLLPKEKKIINGKFTKQEVTDVIWTYEAYWVLIWALGYVNELNFPKDICDVEVAKNIATLYGSYEEFKQNAKLKDIEEVLDQLDLYYRYHWAVDEKRINPETAIGELNPDVVIERRRALEWLVSKQHDWNEISMDT